MAEKARLKLMLGEELMFPSDYLGGPDLKGSDVVVTIETVSKQELVMVGGKKKTKPVLTFVGKKKKLVCNSTNAQSIAFLHGKQAAAWVGKQITLYPTTTTFGRQTVDCIRVREVLPKGAPAAKADTLAAAMNVNGVALPSMSEEPPEDFQGSLDADEFTKSLAEGAGESSHD